jgi:hypothetical protein
VHLAAYDYIATQAAEYGPFRNVVEIGARDINGSIRGCFHGAAYVSVDIAEGPGVDHVCDGAVFKPEVAPDCVVCTEVLEHAPNAREIVENMIDMATPGGYVFITCAGPGRHPHSAIDGNALQAHEHYANVSVEEIADWAAPHQVLTDTAGADTRATIIKNPA